MRCRELDIFKIRNFLRNRLEIFWSFSGFFGEFFWNYLGIFFEDFLGEIFWEDFFGRKFLGGIFWEEFFGRYSLLTLLKSAKSFEYGRNWFVCQDIGFCQDFVSIKKDKKFRSLELRRKLIALKKSKWNAIGNQNVG